MDKASSQTEADLSGLHLGCLLCEKCFVGIDALQEHHLSHFPSVSPEPIPKSHTCDLCGRALHSLQELRKHYKEYHEALVSTESRTGEFFECDRCAKYFVLRDYLNLHLKLKHSEWEIKKPNDSDHVLQNPQNQNYPPYSAYMNGTLRTDYYV
ncbi:uncharacterized zinc finger protein CG12744 [Drosophila miranda]|uniref:uncharacterized zinc finger protein CG12744 n=1 Tax=Drosophila miranda TaxID=7229 RepID=UPI0007E5C801|nr:uncharacterized zinc finger protein CG12744 [Drosophila miranda]XP_017150444.1 uncharacterized zinc finger protein CG12744 [Drosophila miranda]XP_033246550.1 uncharacterized zinc finger protein CG12744 [Drosophila miranda]